jgi:hypothetical protein
MAAIGNAPPVGNAILDEDGEGDAHQHAHQGVADLQVAADGADQQRENLAVNEGKDLDQGEDGNYVPCVAGSGIGNHRLMITHLHAVLFARPDRRSRGLSYFLSIQLDQ